MKYDTILFDLDGTLTESGVGITRSAAYACERMGVPVVSMMRSTSLSSDAVPRA